MLQDLTKQQRALAEYMSYLSEEAYCASWIKNLEYDLWNALESEPDQYGRVVLTANIIDRLKELSLAAQGWIYYDDEREETFLSFEEWEQKRLKI